jgi:hypothetical protein
MTQFSDQELAERILRGLKETRKKFQPKPVRAKAVRKAAPHLKPKRRAA